MRAASRSVVLRPYGLPDAETDREACTKFILRAGGDIDRLIDQPAADIERFARHAARIPVLRDEEPADRPIVMITRTTPLPLTTVAARRTLEAAVPSLRLAAWMVYVNISEDPFFDRAASELGVVNGDLSTAPIWVAGRHAFLVCSRAVTDFGLVRTRLDQLYAYGEKLTRRTTTAFPPPPAKR